MNHQLIIGNKNYSSWSLRPWLLMQVNAIPFEEIRIPLYREDSREQILRYSPSGKVPFLKNETVAIGDSLAICEYIAETYPQKHCWPSDSTARAEARSVAAEMHSGFQTIRNQLPMNCRRKMTIESINESLQQEISRIDAIWQTCRSRYHHQGDFLFGQFSIADAMYAPVVIRFDSYGIQVSPVAERYKQTMLSLEPLQRWIADGIAENEVIASSEI